MDLISQFISRYRKEYDFYEKACRMTAQVLDSNLQSAGIRATVTSRAKSPVRLETKVRQRVQSHAYGSVDDTSRYAVYERVRALDVPALVLTSIDLPRASQSEAIGQFMALWIDYERMLRAVAATKGYKSIGMPSGRFLSTISEISQELIEAAERLRHFRNQFVHGIEVPDSEYIRAQTSDLKKLIELMRHMLKPPPKTSRKSTKKAPK